MSEPGLPRSHFGLIVSLCVNLVLAGIIAMAGYRIFMMPPEPVPAANPQPSPQPPERGQVRQVLSPRFMTKLAPEKKEQILAVVEAHHATLDHLKVEANAARRELLTAFSAPTLDKAALDKAFARTQQADAAVEVEIMKTAGEIAPLLTAEQRKKAAEWRMQHGPMGPMGEGGGFPWHRGHPDHGPQQGHPQDRQDR
jgi:Predicted integral membrane protein